MANLKPRIAHKEEVGKLLKPIVVGGDILAYSYVRELNRAFGIEQTIVLAAADIKIGYYAAVLLRKDIRSRAPRCKH